MSDSPSPRHDPLADRNAVIDCVQAYCARIDEFDWVRLGALFTDHAVVQYGDREPEIGGAATAALLEGLCATTRWHQHTAQVVEVVVDGDAARTITYFTAHAVMHDDPDVVVVSVGQYRDVLRRTPDGWRIAERRQRTGWRERRRRS